MRNRTYERIIYLSFFEEIEINLRTKLRSYKSHYNYNVIININRCSCNMNKYRDNSGATCVCGIQLLSEMSMRNRYIIQNPDTQNLVLTQCYRFPGDRHT